jgi:putative peptide zinc metalloprotease protein
MTTTDEKPTQRQPVADATGPEPSGPQGRTASVRRRTGAVLGRITRGRHGLRLPRRRGARRDSAPSAPPPRLADGLELIGEYQESGFKKAPYIARRTDGQMVQLPELLYRLAEQIDGARGYDEIASRLSTRVQRDIDGETAELLVDKKLRPLGVAAAADGTSPQLQKVDPLLGLKLRAAVVPKSVTRSLTTLFLPFFKPFVVVLVLGALVAVDVWFFFFHGVAQSLRAIAYTPLLFLMVIGLVVLATALHEIGHATAARYGGAEPGAMGVGIYIVWPAFYTDVTDAYRLSRRGRLRTDLGGVYFNGLFVLGIVGAYALTRFEPLLVLILVQHMQVLQQFLPFLRLDGYYVLSDLTGVPDMFRRMKPTLKSALPWADREPEVEELKPWVRRVTTAWVVLLIPVLLGVFALLIVNAPRMIATAYDSLLLQIDLIRAGSPGGIAVGAVQSLVLVLPLAGLTYTLGRIGGRLSAGVWSWSAVGPARRAVVLPAAIALGALAGYILTPNGDYRPIQATERGTIRGALSQLGAIHTGRPGLTPQREQELGGAPTARSLRSRPGQDTPGPSQGEEPAGTGTGTGTGTETTGGAPRPAAGGSETGPASGTQTAPDGSTSSGTGTATGGTTTGAAGTTAPPGTSTGTTGAVAPPPTTTTAPSTTTAPTTTTTAPPPATTAPPPTTTEPPPATTAPPPTTTEPPPTTTTTATTTTATTTTATSPGG